MVRALTRTYQREASAYENVQLHAAPMNEMFGTHHSKMMILFRHDDTAQVIIHTANMIPKDWTNMTNAVWASPMLPKRTESAGVEQNLHDAPIGSGHRFKADLLNYLRSYDSRRITCKPLADRLGDHDFSDVKGALVASVPGRHDVHNLDETPWGWNALKRYLKTIPSAPGKSEVVVQISSIATLGAKDDWLQKTLFGPLAMSKNLDASKPRFKVVFPTADEIRRSLDGYSSGGSIHTKIQSKQQEKQLDYLRPIFYHWANDSPGGAGELHAVPCVTEPPANSSSALGGGASHADGGRNRAAPHIKTYTRYNGTSIDWALLTSANLSKQAWGETVQATTGQARIASWEIGVLVWPGLFETDGLMVPTFMKDNPDVAEDSDRTIIGVRVPYSVPLQRYGNAEVPWVASMVHTEPDWMGQRWGVE